MGGLVDSGQWQRTSRGIYYAGRDAPAWTSHLWAATLAGGPEAIIGGAAAASLHQISPAQPDVIHVFVPPGRDVRSPAGARFSRSRIIRRTQHIAGLRCTTVPETILDCAAELPGDDLEALIGRAFQRGLCN